MKLKLNIKLYEHLSDKSSAVERPDFEGKLKVLIVN